LVNSRLGRFPAALLGSAPERASLLPKLRDQFAEFLNESSPDRRAFLTLPTSVGLRYGRCGSPQSAFLAPCVNAIGTPRGLPAPCGWQQLQRYHAPVQRGSLTASTKSHRCWNIDQLSIAYALRPRLRPDSPYADKPSVGTLRHSAGMILTSLTLLMPAFALPHAPPVFTLELHCGEERSPTTQYSLGSRRSGTKSKASVASLSPGTLSAPGRSTSELLRTLSRMAASKPTSWLSKRTDLLAH